MTGVPRQWVLASSNPGKLREIQAILAPSGLEVLPQSAFGLHSAEETGATFVENALLKARHAAAETGLATIADDSGLVVAALLGQPGICSARFAGPGADDHGNIAKLLRLLENTPEEDRGAKFHCVIVALLGPDDPAPLIGSGAWPGVILREPKGASGFGYDPVFLDPELGATAAELPPEVKNQVSHRGQALAEIQHALSEAG